MRTLLLFAVALLGVWVAAVAFFKVVGFAIHLLLLGAALLLVTSAVRRLSESRRGLPPG